MSSTSLQTFYTANSSLSSWYSSARQTVNTTSTAPSNNSYHYSVASINSRKSRKNVLYPCRAHRPPVTMLPECIGSPDMLTWEVRYLCATLLPHSETRLLPAGIVLLKSLGKERDLSQRKNEEARHCSVLFIVLSREVLLKDAIGVVELEGPCERLHSTFNDIFLKSGAFSDTPIASNLNEMGLRAPRAETQGPERFTGVLHALLSIMDAFEAALNTINFLAVSDKALREHRHRVSPGFSVVRDLTIDQYRKVLGQKLTQDPPFQKEQQVTHSIPSSDGRGSINVATRVRAKYYDIVEAHEADAVQQGIEEAKRGAPQAIATMKEDLESEDEWDIVDYNSESCSNLRIFASFFTTFTGIGKKE
ncbi:hypothetical protein BJY52DRAFT_1415264 [Lactarius psammicola]|nr:hypothetical protein BJY52DRAFT_1415264 [Lactarius psammicola]